jgi:DNA polymerase I-like protein with 3'-5' exonuclease and polymerase domains
MKKALVLLDESIKSNRINAQFVANVHDEWQIEVDEKDAELVGQLGVDAIKQAGIELDLRCPLTGEYRVGKTWKDTH